MPESAPASRPAVGLLAAVAAAVFSLYDLRPPAPLAVTAAANQFSAERAMDHIRRIAVAPHPSGSPANTAVRDYILAVFRQYRLKPQVQESIGVWRGGRYASAAVVRNIAARLPGSQSGKAVMLVGHYDSVPTGPGAGDDGHSVGVLLETLRALRAGPALRHDVIFLLTDGEELDMLGAAAFVNEHPWAADVAVVLNFEARGTGGPAHMFETSEGNGWLIREFAQAAPYPRTDSISYEVYRRLPNDTDLTVFKRHGYTGLNFAFIENVFFYHTAFDDVAHLDRGSVQQQGGNALALARQFGNADLTQTKAPDVVYFTVPGRKVVVYPQAMVWPLALVATIALLMLIVTGLRRHALTIWGTVRGLLAFVLVVIAAPAATWTLWRAASRLFPAPAYSFIQPYNWRWYEIAFLAFTLAIAVAIYAWFRRRTSIADLTAAGLVVWMATMLAACVLAPLVSYLFTWALLLALPAFCTALFRSRGQTLCMCIGGAVAAWLVVPYIDLLFVSLTVAAGWLPMALLVLLLGILLPLWIFAARLPIAIAFALAGVLLLAGAALTAGFSPDHPKPATVFYALDSQTGRALWVSDALIPDAWMAQFIPAGSPRGPVPKFLPSGDVQWAPAPLEPLAAPEIEVAADHVSDAARTLVLRVRSPRHAQGLVMIADPTVRVHGLSVNGRPMNGDKSSATFPFRYFSFYGLPAEGIEIRLDLSAKTPLHLRVIDCSDGIPGTYQPRPPGIMRSILYWPYNETTVVSRDFEIQGR